MGRVSVILGVFVVLIGGLWFLQGIGVLGGSAMSGQSFWAIVGGLLVLGGLALCALGLRRGAPRPRG